MIKDISFMIKDIKSSDQVFQNCVPVSQKCVPVSQKCFPVSYKCFSASKNVCWFPEKYISHFFCKLVKILRKPGYIFWNTRTKFEEARIHFWETRKQFRETGMHFLETRIHIQEAGGDPFLEFLVNSGLKLHILPTWLDLQYALKFNH